MPQKSETPAVGSGVSRNSGGACFRDALGPSARHAQFPIAAHHVHPQMAAMMPCSRSAGMAMAERYPDIASPRAGGCSSEEATELRICSNRDSAMRSLDRFGGAMVLDAAAVISIGRSKIHALIADGRLKARKIDRRTVISAASLSKLLDS